PGASSQRMIDEAVGSNRSAEPLQHLFAGFEVLSATRGDACEHNGLDYFRLEQVIAKVVHEDRKATLDGGIVNGQVIRGPTRRARERHAVDLVLGGGIRTPSECIDGQGAAFR